jgi:Zn-finger nucleic acid-binding protein
VNCPLCIDEVLDIRFHGGIEVDVCPRCRGVWLDRGELQRLLDDTPPPARRTDDRDRRPPERERDEQRDRRPKPSRKKRLSDRLGDVFEEVLDL